MLQSHKGISSSHIFLAFVFCSIVRIPYETGASINWTSRVIFPLFKKLKNETYMTKTLKNVGNPSWVLFDFKFWYRLLTREKGFTPQILVEVDKAISALKTKGKRIYTLVFLLKREIFKKVYIHYWLIYLFNPSTDSMKASALALCCWCLTELQSLLF